MELIGQSLFRAGAALLPVLLFLSALFYFDSFKVVRLGVDPRRDGDGAARRHRQLLGEWRSCYDVMAVSFTNFSRFVSPWLEESAQGERCSST